MAKNPKSNKSAKRASDRIPQTCSTISFRAGASARLRRFFSSRLVPIASKRALTSRILPVNTIAPFSFPLNRCRSASSLAST